ncbi:unnamed protein product [Nezara viridula]|uniref:Uncharacterized protein n=1 Tax=Nezara viridula TaxID=85310 RepID=A0A9P0HFJ2_NEZVI|nr:unnamed protein product [Nezara viridula]
MTSQNLFNYPLIAMLKASRPRFHFSQRRPLVDFWKIRLTWVNPPGSVLENKQAARPRSTCQQLTLTGYTSSNSSYVITHSSSSTSSSSPSSYHKVRDSQSTGLNRNLNGVCKSNPVY